MLRQFYAEMEKGRENKLSAIVSQKEALNTHDVLRRQFSVEVSLELHLYLISRDMHFL